MPIKKTEAIIIKGCYEITGTTKTQKWQLRCKNGKLGKLAGV